MLVCSRRGFLKCSCVNNMDTIATPKSVLMRSLASVTTDEMPEDAESEVNFIDESRPRATVSIGVGSLRQIALNIISETLTNLKNVKTKMATNIQSRRHSLQRNSISQDSKNDWVYTDENQNSLWESDVNLTKRLCNPGFQSDQINDTLLTAEMKTKQLPVSQNPEMPIFMPQEEMKGTVRDRVHRQLNDIFPDDRVRRETFQSTLEASLSAPTAQLLMDAVSRTFRVNHQVLLQWGVEGMSRLAVDPVDASGVVSLKVDFSTNTLRLSWDELTFGSDFLHFVAMLNTQLREERRQPTYAEHVAIHQAYSTLSSGTHHHQPFKPLGTPGFRPLQFISISDPGVGHIQTSRFNELLIGTLLSVEEVDFDADTFKSDSKISPLMNLSKVRLHVGDSSPLSYFLGKALVLLEDQEDNSKDLQMIACAASTAFKYGAAECTICTCGLRTSQVIRFMRALRAKVNCSDSQCLSAIWQLDRALIHDYECPEPVEFIEHKDIMRTALEMTSIGGFDTVSLDLINPCSDDIVDGIGFEDALTFNHEAHSKGLLTQFFTGCSIGQVQNALFTGVDVIRVRNISSNIGTDAKVQNQNLEGDIQQILEIRNEASESVRGRGVGLLARLDTMFAEGSITKQEDQTRKRIFKALKTKSEKAIKHLLNRHDVPSPSNPTTHLEDLARRIVSSPAPMLREGADSRVQWQRFTQRLETALAGGDLECLTEEYQNEPWCTLRRRLKMLQS